jgi:hypothetical protein
MLFWRYQLFSHNPSHQLPYKQQSLTADPPRTSHNSPRPRIAGWLHVQRSSAAAAETPEEQSSAYTSLKQSVPLLPPNITSRRPASTIAAAW